MHEWEASWREKEGGRDRERRRRRMVMRRDTVTRGI
jgi:hypothetical protein